TPPPAAVQTVTPYDATMATINGMTGAIPGLQQGSDALLAGGQSIADMVTGQPVDFGARYNAIRAQRDAIANKAPIANFMGGFAPMVALGGVPAAAEAMGLTGSLGKQLANSTLFSAGINGLQGLAQGDTGANLLKDEGIGAAAGAAGSMLGQGINKLGQSAADAMTRGAQNRVIDAAVQGKNASAGDLKSAGSQMF